MTTFSIGVRTALPTIEVEELPISETIVLGEHDYSWYEFYGELCLCVAHGSPAYNNTGNPLPVPAGYCHR